jgi:aspartyl protease family protein
MKHHHRIASIALGLLVSTGAAALDVNLVGLFPNKALIQIEGGAMRTLAVGEKTRDNVTLLSVTRDSATFDVQGQRVALGMGPARTKSSSVAESQTTGGAAGNYAVVRTHERGELVADGIVNGVPIRFAVDTGATFITLPGRDAARLGLDYRKGQKLVMETANGDVAAYRLKLDTVSVGNVVLNDVDAVILEGDSLSIALLGMSFLNRTDIKREGTTLTLTKRQ